MIRPNYTIVRSTALSIATAIAISIPAMGTNSQSQTSRKKHCKATASVRKYQVSSNIASALKGLNLRKELGNGILMSQRPSNDAYYGAECLKFKTELKGIISDFMAVICVVPALSTDYMLIDNLETALTLVDYIPARSLFLMWKTLGEQLERIRTAINSFGLDLSVIPPLKDYTFFNEATYTYEASCTGHSNIDTSNANNLTRPLFNKSFVELFQARIEMFAFRLGSFTDLMPDNRVRVTDTETNDVRVALISSEQVKAPLELIAMNS